MAFEDAYHHVPRLLRDCGLPMEAAGRSDGDPIVVGGGMAFINPMPLSPFFDVMVIGEGRPAMVEIGRRVAAGRRRRTARGDLLRDLATIPHVYVPSLYTFEHDGNGAVVDVRRDPVAPAEVTAARPLDLTDHPIHSIWTSERACYKYDDYYSVMVAMGCHLKCPFCVVGNAQGSAGGWAMNICRDRILDLARARRAAYVTNLVKLFFASSFARQSAIDPLSLRGLLDSMLSENFTCRVGSLNMRQADGELLGLIRRAGQERVTFAPETGATLRQSIGKPYSKDDKLLAVAELAGGYDLGLDLYTMLGVPGEQPRHVRELADLIRRVRRALANGRTLEVSINPVFGKAQTPYERYTALRPEEARRRFAYLRAHLGEEDGIEWVSVIDDAMAYYQPILALGGPELAPVLIRLSSSFRPDEAAWRQAVADLVPGGDARYFRDRAADEVLPWQHIVFNRHEKLALRLEAHRMRAVRG